MSQVINVIALEYCFGQSQFIILTDLFSNVNPAIMERDREDTLPKFERQADIVEAAH